MQFKRSQFYRCPVCETVIEVLEESGYELVCCGPPMQLLEHSTNQSGDGAHAISLSRTPDGIKVRVGDSGHPMRKTHSIRWIEVVSGSRCYRQFLRQGDPPEALFPPAEGEISALAYCNVHGLLVAKSQALPTGSPRAAKTRRAPAPTAA